MAWSNFHTHSRYCDGAGELKEYINEAIRQGVNVLGFSSHAPMPFETCWTMSNENFIQYCDAIRELRRNNSSLLQIKVGLEIDYLEGVIEPNQKKFKSLGLDYSIGSVHFLAKNNHGEYVTADDSYENFEAGINQIFGGDIKKAVLLYYHLVRDMVKKGGFDIIGHLDLIKKNNPKNKYFSEDEAWYREIVMETLTAISKSGLILEVNTGGKARGYVEEIYPSEWILSECNKKNIPITLNSDAHSPQNIKAYFEETAEKLLQIGYKELQVLGDYGWEAKRFSKNGIEK